MKLFCPTFYSFPSSLMCLFIYSLDIDYNTEELVSITKFLLNNEFRYKFTDKTVEILEFYISFFLLIYILSINSRLKK
jgi:uncharacterized protein YktA (UPF0223 family)